MALASSTTTSILDGLSSSISEHLTATIQGTESFKSSMSAIFAELGKNIIETLVQIATKALIVKAITGIGGALSGSFSGGAASSTSTGFDTGAFAASLPGFATGGFTGGGGTNDIAGVVHGKEFVFDAASTRSIGVANLEAIRSGKLNNTMERVTNQSAASRPVYSPSINIPINGNPSDATIALVKKAADEGAVRGYQKGVNSVVTGQGQLHKALMTKTQAGRKVR